MSPSSLSGWERRPSSVRDVSKSVLQTTRTLSEPLPECRPDTSPVPWNGPSRTNPRTPVCNHQIGVVKVHRQVLWKHLPDHSQTSERSDDRLLRIAFLEDRCHTL